MQIWSVIFSVYAGSHHTLICLQVTVKEQKEWKIPPCISNWKNAKVCLMGEFVFVRIIAFKLIICWS